VRNLEFHVEEPMFYAKLAGLHHNTVITEHGRGKSFYTDSRGSPVPARGEQSQPLDCNLTAAGNSRHSPTVAESIPRTHEARNPESAHGATQLGLRIPIRTRPREVISRKDMGSRGRTGELEVRLGFVRPHTFLPPLFVSTSSASGPPPQKTFAASSSLTSAEPWR